MIDSSKIGGIDENTRTRTIRRCPVPRLKILLYSLIALCSGLANAGTITLTTTGQEQQGLTGPCEAMQNPAPFPGVCGGFGSATAQLNNLGLPQLAGFSLTDQAGSESDSSSFFTSAGMQSQDFVVLGGTGAGVLTLEFRFTGTGHGDFPEGTINANFLIQGVQHFSICQPGNFSSLACGSPPQSYLSIDVAIPIQFGTIFTINQGLSSNAFSSTQENASMDIESFLNSYSVTDSNGVAVPGAVLSQAPEPATLPLSLCAAGVGLAMWRRRRHQVR